MGPCRIAPLADASAASLHRFVMDHVEPGATVITDGWQGYSGIEKRGYVHDRRSQRAAQARGEEAGKLLPAVHQVTSLANRWLLGTHQGSAEQTHLASHLNEFVFRFNRRTSRSRGMVFCRVLEFAVAHAPVRYQHLIAKRRPRQVPPTPPQMRGHPPSLERPPANRPWRTAVPRPLRLNGYPRLRLIPRRSLVRSSFTLSLDPHRRERHGTQEDQRGENHGGHPLRGDLRSR